MRNSLRVIIGGFLTGMVLQVAIGPVFFYLVHLTLQGSLADGLMGVAAATAADYIFICLAIAGVGRWLQSDRNRKMLGFGGAIVLVTFGTVMVWNAVNSQAALDVARVADTRLLFSFTSTFALTISSPLTIVFWTGLFASRALEKGYAKGEVVLFGIAAGAATLVFLGLSMAGVSFVGSGIPADAVSYMNAGVGVLLFSYGAIRFLKMLRQRKRTPQ